MWTGVFPNSSAFLRSGVVASYGESAFDFLINCQIFPAGAESSPTGSAQFLYIAVNTYSYFLKIAVMLGGTRWHFIVVFCLLCFYKVGFIT